MNAPAERPIVKQITLTRGKVALVDDADYETLSRRSWHAAKRGGAYYAMARIDGRLRYMHRVMLGAPPGITVDHINGNGLDNRRCNLRLATPRQQAWNSRAKGGVSRFKGVFLDKRDGAWYAQITKDRKCYHLGRYETAREAAVAYDAAAEALFHEFAKTNKEGAHVMASFIKSEPCSSCDDYRVLDRETGFVGCRRTYAGDCECSDYLEMLLIDEELAPQAAALIRRVHDETKRRELAIAWGDGFANMLYLQEMGTEFDEVAFLAACGLKANLAVTA